jgi:hypothetical protein
MLFHGVPVRDHFDDQRILVKPFVQAGLEFIQDGHRCTNAFLGNFFVFRKRDLFTNFTDFTDFFLFRFTSEPSAHSVVKIYLLISHASSLFEDESDWLHNPAVVAPPVLWHQ